MKAIEVNLSTECIKNIIQLTTDIKNTNIYGQNVWHMLATGEECDVAVCNLLEKYYKEGKLTPDNNGYLPIHYSAWNGFVGTTEYLIKLGGGINSKGQCGFTPAICTVQNDQVDVLDLLIKNEASLEETDNKGCNVWHHLALGKENSQKVYDLLEKYYKEGKWTSSTNNMLAIHTAIVKGSIKSTELLLKMYDISVLNINDLLQFTQTQIKNNTQEYKAKNEAIQFIIMQHIDFNKDTSWKNVNLMDMLKDPKIDIACKITFLSKVCYKYKKQITNHFDYLDRPIADVINDVGKIDHLATGFLRNIDVNKPLVEEVIKNLIVAYYECGSSNTYLKCFHIIKSSHDIQLNLKQDDVRKFLISNDLISTTASDAINQSHTYHVTEEDYNKEYGRYEIDVTGINAGTIDITW